MKKLYVLFVVGALAAASDTSAMSTASRYFHRGLAPLREYLSNLPSEKQIAGLRRIEARKIEQISEKRSDINLYRDMDYGDRDKFRYLLHKKEQLAQERARLALPKEHQRSSFDILRSKHIYNLKESQYKNKKEIDRLENRALLFHQQQNRLLGQEEKLVSELREVQAEIGEVREGMALTNRLYLALMGLMGLGAYKAHNLSLRDDGHDSK